jgi:copper(I)-binding protein
MSFTTCTRAAAAAILLALPGLAVADGIMVMDPYARSSGPNAPAGAAFMVLHNTSGQDDRLVSASSEIAARVELHTHIDKGDGVMQMVEIEEGITIPAGEKHMMVRGGDHVMFMGLNQSLVQGESVQVTLTFENAGDVVVDIPVDHERKDEGGHGHSN